MSSTEIRWGVIGAGDVVLRKSGGPLQSLPDSRWLGLTRRNRRAAEDMASRFHVPRVYGDASSLLADPDINAVYIATPPSTHADYAVMALEAGKDVYLEKPMARSVSEAEGILSAVNRTGRRLVMAHYRRALPAFEAVKGLLVSRAVGDPLFARIRIIQPPMEQSSIIAGNTSVPGTKPAEPRPWRLEPSVSGGGLFHDLAPHQLDLCLDWFGSAESVSGLSRVLGAGSVSTHPNSAAASGTPDDYVAGHIRFSSGVQLDGLWCFRADSPERSADEFAIYGTQGCIRFSFFGEKVVIETSGGREVRPFPLPEWLQEPMLARTVDYFLDRAPNPCSAQYGVDNMRILDVLTGKLQPIAR